MSAIDSTRVVRRRTSALRAATWVAALAIVTALLLLVRGRADKAHIALAYLLLVLAGSASGGRTVGLALAGASFVAFNYLFLPPYYTLVIADPLDWLVLLAFLAVGVVAAQLLARAQGEAADARLRAGEVQSFASLGAETLNMGRAEDALVAVASVIRTTLGVRECTIYLCDEAGHCRPARGTSADAAEGAGALVEWVARHGTPAVERLDGTRRLGSAQSAAVPDDLLAPLLPDVCALVLPLRVRGETVGVVRVRDDRTLAFDAPARRFLGALAYYAALGAERARLSATAEHAEALREADRLKDALLASVSHDLRTPLTTIKALAHDLGAGGDERARIIEEESDRLNRLVANLLDLSRLSAGGLPMAPDVNAADDLLGAALARVAGIVGDRVIHASVVPDAGAGDDAVLLGRFDLVQTLRALVNLIENAHKYSPSAQPIDVIARRDGQRLLFEVADRGTGVPETERERIFAAFYRPAGSVPDAESAGLGLAIARRIAEAQQGTLTYRSRDGGGSVFALALPAVVASADEPL